MKIVYRKTRPDAFPLKIGKRMAAGVDVKTPYDLTIAPHESICVDTGIALDIPPGVYCRVAPKSKLALKYCIDVKGGVVDRYHTDNIFVILHNFHKTREVQFKRGNKIAQFVFEKCAEVTSLVDKEGDNEKDDVEEEETVC